MKGETMSEYELMREIGSNIKNEIDYRYMSQNELARLTGISRGTISYYINAKRMPSLKHIVNICLALDCGLDSIIPMYGFIR